MELEIINSLSLWSRWGFGEGRQAAAVLLHSSFLYQKFNSEVDTGLCIVDFHIVDLRINWSASGIVRQEMCLGLRYFSSN